MELTQRGKGAGFHPLRGNRCVPSLSNHTLLAAFLALVLALLPGCSRKPAETPQQRAEAAKALFERTTKSFHTPSAEAKGVERDKLLAQAAEGYEELLKKYSDQDFWAAQALRGLGDIHAAQGKLDAAIKDLASVEQKYPRDRWEILVSRKSAADLLWDAGRKYEAKVFYQRIVAGYNATNAPQVEQTIVRGCTTRLAAGDLPSGQ